jgi:UDP-N-acetylglucosamine 2-epimerase
MKKAALVVGARPQFIKTAPLILELGRFFQIVLIHTGQHYDFEMSETFFKELRLPDPDYHLNTPGGSHGRQTGRMLEGLDSVMNFEKPDLTIVVGDTNSTLAGALAAAKMSIPLVHVEAGVRSRDDSLPEQINRVVTDSVAECMLCPTPSAVRNLNREGRFENVYDTGDIIYDCLRMFEKNIPAKPSLPFELPRRYVLATLHRAEAVDDAGRLRSILQSLATSPYPIAMPLHPRTRKMIDRFGLRSLISDELFLTEPVGYADLLSLMKSSEFVITDSGGVQRETVYFGRFVYVTRPETEWRELEESGWVKVIGYDFDLSGGVQQFGQPHGDLTNLMRPASRNMAETVKSLF